MAHDIAPHDIIEFFPRKTRFCFATIVFNEGDRIKNQLKRMRERTALADIIIVDGGSTDGSMEPSFLREQGVRTLLTTQEPGLSTATAIALSYALEQGYEGVITIDGNGKDGVEALPMFIAELEAGFDLIQGSRFMKGGFHKNTPWDRYIGIRFIMAPIVALSGFWYTDPTNAFRAMSRRFLTDQRVQPLRRVFVRFSLQHYLIYRAAKLGFKVKEIPVRRVYPDDGSVPTKINGIRLKFLDLWELMEVVRGRFDPR